MTEHLVNPSQSAMREMATRDSDGHLLRREEVDSLRALLTEDDNLYVWRSGDETHYSFASSVGVSDKTKAWLYIDTVQNKVRFSTWSHRSDELKDVVAHVKGHKRFQFFEFDLPDIDDEA